MSKSRSARMRIAALLVGVMLMVVGSAGAASAARGRSAPAGGGVKVESSVPSLQTPSVLSRGGNTGGGVRGINAPRPPKMPANFTKFQHVGSVPACNLDPYSCTLSLEDLAELLDDYCRPHGDPSCVPMGWSLLTGNPGLLLCNIIPGLCDPGGPGHGFYF